MDSSVQLKFLEKSLETTYALWSAYDNKANFLLGVSGVLLLWSAGQPAGLPVALLCLLSILACIYSISLPYRKLNKSQFSLFCWWGVQGKSYEEYYKDFTEHLQTEADVIKEYTKEIYPAPFHGVLKYPRKELPSGNPAASYAVALARRARPQGIKKVLDLFALL